MAADSWMIFGMRHQPLPLLPHPLLSQLLCRIAIHGLASDGIRESQKNLRVDRCNQVVFDVINHDDS